MRGIQPPPPHMSHLPRRGFAQGSSESNSRLDQDFFTVQCAANQWLPWFAESFGFAKWLSSLSNRPFTHCCEAEALCDQAELRIFTIFEPQISPVALHITLSARHTCLFSQYNAKSTESDIPLWNFTAVFYLDPKLRQPSAGSHDYPKYIDYAFRILDSRELL